MVTHQCRTTLLHHHDERELRASSHAAAPGILKGLYLLAKSRWPPTGLGLQLLGSGRHLARSDRSG